MQAYLETYGYAPTMAEIGAELGCSKQRASALVAVLVDRGALRRDPVATWRGLQLPANVNGTSTSAAVRRA